MIKAKLRIGQSIRDLREQKNYTLSELASYLHSHWGIEIYGAVGFIRDVEKGIGFKKTNVDRNVEQRVSDYLSSLGIIDDEEKEIILYGIDSIYPNFRILPSDIKPYKTFRNNSRLK